MPEMQLFKPDESLRADLLFQGWELKQIRLLMEQAELGGTPGIAAHKLLRDIQRERGLSEAAKIDVDFVEIDVADDGRIQEVEESA